MNPGAPAVDPTWLFYAALGIVLLIALILVALKAPQPPVVKHDDDALKRAQLDVATRLGRSQSVIVPRSRNGRIG